jgi:hypothetical protein
MTSQNFSTTFSVDQTPEEVFKAIKNVRGWWSEEIEGSTDKLGGEFTYHYRDVHRCKIKITKVVPGKKVVWLVVTTISISLKTRASGRTLKSLLRSPETVTKQRSASLTWV